MARMKVFEHPEGPGADARSSFFEAFWNTFVGKGGGATGRVAGGRRGARLRACVWSVALPGGVPGVGCGTGCGIGGVGWVGTPGVGVVRPAAVVEPGGSQALSRFCGVCFSLRFDRSEKDTV